jgi:hypothetical protein
MADIHIRDVDDELFRRLKVQAAEQGITLKQLVLRRLEPDQTTLPAKSLGGVVCFNLPEDPLSDPLHPEQPDHLGELLSKVAAKRPPKKIGKHPTRCACQDCQFQRKYGSAGREKP